MFLCSADIYIHYPQVKYCVKNDTEPATEAK